MTNFYAQYKSIQPWLQKDSQENKVRVGLRLQGACMAEGARGLRCVTLAICWRDEDGVL